MELDMNAAGLRLREIAVAVEAANRLRRERSVREDGSDEAAKTDEHIRRKETEAEELLGQSLTDAGYCLVTKPGPNGREWQEWLRPQDRQLLGI